ncbi:major facilitator superfamily domain-containing protein 6 [Euwallacea fornicatus]|uniref:major facilitator superfamily domain-containing protein 6 n=1 Tax=Euwallacea fornicatus TaxID=995702 RepID=UPI00338EE7A1
MKMKFKVNKALLPMKTHYFLWNAGTGPVTPYLSTYSRQLGFSSTIVGVIYTILPISGMIAKPFAGAIADRFHCQKYIFLFTQLLTAVAFISILYSPKIGMRETADFSCVFQNVSLQNIKEVTINSEVFDRIHNQNIDIDCQLTCPLSSNDLEVLCADWQLSQYCGNNATSEIIFTAQMPLNQTQLLDSIMVFRIANIKGENQVFNPQCNMRNITSRCAVQCNHEDVDNLLENNQIEDERSYRTYQFWVFLVLMITGWVGQAVNVSISDAICFEMLGDKPNRYGYQRMYGALGWGILTLIAGILVDVASVGKTYQDYTICFYLGASFLIIDFLASCRLKYAQTKLSSNITRDIGKLLVNIRVLVFLVWCVAVGMCTGLMWNFFLWLVEDLGNARNDPRVQTLKGILMGVQCLGGELPFFFLSGKILKKIGHVNAMSLVLLTLGVRFILYSVIENPWYFIPIECSNGLTYGVFYACMASYASIIAPIGTEATMQGVVGAVFEGIGASIGSLCGGYAISSVDGTLTFRYFGFGALGICALHVIVQWLLRSADGSSPVVDKKHAFQKVRLEDQKELTSIGPLISR